MTRTDFILKYVLARAAVRPDGINLDTVLKDAEKAWQYANKEQV